MKPTEFYKRIARMTGLKPAMVRDVVEAMPVVLMTMKSTESTLCPLGKFYMIHNKPYRVTLPTGREHEVEERLVLKLKMKKTLRVMGSDPNWNSFLEENDD